MAMMSLARERIGIVADGAELQCALIRSGKVAWSTTLPVGDTDVAAAVQAAIKTVPGNRLRSTVVIALGPKWSQLRRLRDLPPMPNDRIARAAMSQSAGRFFLKNGTPLATTGVSWTGDREGWSAAFEQPLVDALCSACAPGRVAAIVPLAAFDERAASSIARLDSTHPLSYRPSGAGTADSAPRLLPAAIAVTVAALFAFVAPTVASSVQLVRAERATRLLEPRRAKAVAEERELRDLTSARREIVSLVNNARSQTLFLASLGEAMPRGASLVSLRTDSIGGTVVLRAARADDAVRAIMALPAIATVEIVGPVTRESAQQGSRERVAFRFSWRRADRVRAQKLAAR